VHASPEGRRRDEVKTEARKRPAPPNTIIVPAWLSGMKTTRMQFGALAKERVFRWARRRALPPPDDPTRMSRSDPPSTG